MLDPIPFMRIGLVAAARISSITDTLFGAKVAARQGAQLTKLTRW